MNTLKRVKEKITQTQVNLENAENHVNKKKHILGINC